MNSERYRTAAGVPQRKGDQVNWTHTHRLCRFHATINKHGVFIRLTHSLPGRGSRGKQMALVLFDGREHPMAVPLVDLILMDGEDPK